MVDPGQLASDVVAGPAYFLGPGLAWLWLYLVAFERPTFARSIGFGRLTFWLLLPTGAISSLIILPFFTYHGDILSVDVAGGLVPVLFGTWLLWRPLGWSHAAVGRFLAAVALLAGAMFAALFLPTRVTLGPWSLALPSVALAEFLCAVAAPLLFALVSARGSDPPTNVRWVAALTFALTSAALIGTYWTTESVPGLGISSVFPDYLVLPIAVGALAPVLVGRLGAPRRWGIPIGYVAATFGVLLGADLLREPPLYASKTTGLYAIGGAGLFDLVYLSGLFAAATAFVVYLALERGHDAFATLDDVGGARPRSSSLLRRARQAASGGDPAIAVALARDSARRSAAFARRMNGLPPPSDPSRPWDGLPVERWVVGDHANLEALASSAPHEPTDGSRAVFAASVLDRVGQQLIAGRFADFRERAVAFGIDAAVVAAPATAILAYLILTGGSTFLEVTTNLWVNAAILGLVAAGVVYFVVAEALFGTTLGKSVRHLTVVDRDRQRVGVRSGLLRDIPKALPLTAVILGLTDLLIFARFANNSGAFPTGLSGSAALALGFAGILLFVVTALTVSGVVSMLSIQASGERQRLGDYLAGTWVLKEAVTGSSPPGATAGAPASSG